jgi:hypothetical protein
MRNARHVARESRHASSAAAATRIEWPRYPRILVAVDETAAAAFALRHVVP